MKLCIHPGCKKPRADAGFGSDGKQIFRRKCYKHYRQELLKKRGCSSESEYNDLNAKNRGFKDSYDYKRSIHPYLRFRKNYCENIDGRLGFHCTTTVYWQGMLDVDHIDGNHLNNNRNNLQTLCKCCHSYKTNVNEDYSTPGRKTRLAG